MPLFGKKRAERTNPNNAFVLAASSGNRPKRPCVAGQLSGASVSAPTQLPLEQASALAVHHEASYLPPPYPTSSQVLYDDPPPVYEEEDDLQVTCAPTLADVQRRMELKQQVQIKAEMIAQYSSLITNTKKVIADQTAVLNQRPNPLSIRKLNEVRWNITEYTIRLGLLQTIYQQANEEYHQFVRQKPDDGFGDQIFYGMHMPSIDGIDLGLHQNGSQYFESANIPLERS